MMAARNWPSTEAPKYLLFNKAFPIGPDAIWSDEPKGETAYLTLKVTADVLFDPAAGAYKPSPTPHRQKGTLIASADDYFMLYLNGQYLCHGSWEPVQIPVEIGVGDVITAKSWNIGYECGFICVVTLEGKKVIATSAATWKSFTPGSALSWFDPAGVTNVKTPGKGQPNYLRERFDKVSQVSHEILWSSGAKDPVAYLALVVTPASISDWG